MSYYATASGGRLIMDADTTIPECSMFAAVEWLSPECVDSVLTKHTSDEVIVFIGADNAKPESLNAEILFQIENDTLTLRNTCAVYVPAGAAHGCIGIRNAVLPVLSYKWQPSASRCVDVPAVPTASRGTYANNFIERYAPPDGKLPDAPPGFLSLLLYLDSRRLSGAPYMETTWFNTANDTGPAPHSHDDIDEFIGFVGTDPDNPDALNATVEFWLGGEVIRVTKSTLIFVPRGISHSPIIVPQLSRPIIHFSGGSGGGYKRSGGEGADGNMYKP